MKSTKKSLVMSTLSLIVCVAMLIGTTYAWFTDSVTSGKNKIVAGNLDIELEYSKDMTNWKTVQGATELFSDVALWEPGATSVVYLKLQNKGTLALKYNLTINVEKEIGGTNVAGNAFKLSDYIKFGQVVDVTEKYADRAAARAAIVSAGTVSQYVATGSMEADAADKTIALVLYMPEEVGNEANYKTGTAAPEIEMGINLVATQLMSENDSFDNTYDAGAPWLGGADAVPAPAADGKIHIVTAEQLAGLAKDVNNNNNTYSGKTIVLDSDIDLNNVAWTPMGNVSDYPTKTFAGTFDGQEHTILNLNASDMSGKYAAAGFFGSLAGATIKNLTFKNATVTSSHYAGVVVGYEGSNSSKTNISNVTVDGALITSTPNKENSVYDNGDKAGGIAGYGTSIIIDKCVVKDADINAYRDLGGIIGAADGKFGSAVKNCKIEDVNLNYVFVAPYADDTQNSNMKDHCGRKLNDPVLESNIGEATKGAPNTITTAAELVMFANAVNSGNGFSGQTVKLGNDIDLKNAAFTPIGQGANGFNGIFDGNGKTISNLNVSGEKKVGLFGYVYGGTVEKLTIDGAKVQGINAVGTVCGLAYYSNIKNCTVKNATVTSLVKNNDDGDKVGGVVGRLSVEEGTGSVKNCTAENVTVQGLRQVGGVLGGAYKTSGSYDVSGNTAKNSTIIFDKSNAYSTYATMTDVREVIGTPEVLNSANTATNVSILTMEQDGLIKDATGNYSIANTAGMLAFANMVNGGNTFAGKTVSLVSDIDLAGIAWTPMAGPNTNYDFGGTFDGQNHTIKNMKVTDYTGTYAGFFSRVVGATIKNLKFTNAEVYNAASNEGGRGGIIVGWSYRCVIDNCHVENSKISGGQKVGGILGGMSVESAAGYNKITNCSVKNLTMSANDGGSIYQSGGLLGYIQLISANPNGIQIENNRVENITINNDCGDCGNVGYYNGAFIGTIVNKQKCDEKIVLNNNTVSGTNTAVFAPSKYTSTYFGWVENADHYTSGSLAPIVIDGVTWTPAE